MFSSHNEKNMFEKISVKSKKVKENYYYCITGHSFVKISTVLSHDILYIKTLFK